MSRVLWFCIVLLAGIYICGPIVDPDLWWHIVIGRWVLTNHTVPLIDYWTMFGGGTTWKAYSWLIEIVFASVESTWGISGLLVLKLLLAGVLSVVFSVVFSRIAKDYFFGTLVGIFVTVSTFNHFTLRPQVFVWIYFALLVLVAHEIFLSSLNARKKIALVFIMMLWANTHISSVLGILAVGAWSFKKENPFESILAMGYAFMGTLITPYFGGEWVMFAQTASHPFSHATISEFKPATLLQYSTGFLVVGGALLAAFFHQKPALFDSSKLGLAGIFLVGSLAVVKFLPFEMILIGALLALFWSRAEKDCSSFGNLGEGFLRMKTLYQRIPREGLSFLCICIAIVRIDSLWSNPLDTKITPVAAYDFIAQERLPAPLLNTFGNGGYVLYRQSDEEGRPSAPVAIDGRTNLISGALWDEFITALNGQPGWDRFIGRVKPTTILWKTESPLTSILLEGGKWCLVFSSGTPQSGYSVLVAKDYFDRREVKLASKNCGPVVSSKK